MRQQHRQEEQNVLRPLMDPDGFEPRLVRRNLLRKDSSGRNSGLPECGTETASRVGHHRVLTVFEQRQVSRGVSDVTEAIAEGLAEGGQFIDSRKVKSAIGSKNTVKEAQMLCDSFCKSGIGSRRQVDRPPFSMLLLKKLQKLAVIGQMRDV